ncbi:MAG: hypothetical protein K5843_06680 [Bacteroidales bacterium]|nr:hypothetical protein [Bacteroidales bacterium]
MAPGRGRQAEARAICVLETEDCVFAYKPAAPVEVVSTQVITEGTSDLSDHLPLVVKVRY